MFDPFSVASQAIFNTSIAQDGILTNAQGNHPIRLVETTQLFLDGSGFQAPVPEGRKTFDIIKGTYEIKKGNSLNVNGKTYLIDAILKDDSYVVSSSAKEQ